MIEQIKSAIENSRATLLSDAIGAVAARIGTRPIRIVPRRPGWLGWIKPRPSQPSDAPGAEHKLRRATFC